MENQAKYEKPKNKKQENFEIRQEIKQTSI